MKKQKGFGAIEGIIIVAVVLIIGALVWYALTTRKQTPPVTSSTSSTPSITPTPSNLTEYSDKNFKLSYSYPKTWANSPALDTNSCTDFKSVTLTPPTSELTEAASTVNNPKLNLYRVQLYQYGTQSSKCAADGIDLTNADYTAGFLQSGDYLSSGLLKGKSVTFVSATNTEQNLPSSGFVTNKHFDGSLKKVGEAGTFTKDGSTFQAQIWFFDNTYITNPEPAVFDLTKFKSTQLYKDTLQILNSVK